MLSMSQKTASIAEADNGFIVEWRDPERDFEYETSVTGKQTRRQSSGYCIFTTKKQVTDFLTGFFSGRAK